MDPDRGVAIDGGPDPDAIVLARREDAASVGAEHGGGKRFRRNWNVHKLGTGGGVPELPSSRVGRRNHAAAVGGQVCAGDGLEFVSVKFP